MMDGWKKEAPDQDQPLHYGEGGKGMMIVLNELYQHV